MTTTTDLVDRLTAHRTIGSAPRMELEWLAAHGELREIQPGDLVAEKGRPVNEMFVVLTGHLAMMVRLAHEYLALT
ncbi:MAG TPA: hypothetical protein VF219_19390 [Vicinamibacterales bacterium]